MPAVLLALFPTSTASAPLPAPETQSLQRGCYDSFTRAEFRQAVRTSLKRPPFTARERKRVKHVKKCRATRSAGRRMHTHLVKSKRAYRFRKMGPRAYARHLLRRRPGQYGCLAALIYRESKWNPRARNSSSGAYGIPQALPGSKMASHGSDWAWNPRTQLRWMISYCDGRYGSPCGALAHSNGSGWY